MDLFSIVGIIGAFGFVVFGIIFKQDASGMSLDFSLIGAFINVPSMLLVIGPTMMSLMLTFPGKVFRALPKMIAKIFMPQKFNPQIYITEIVDIAQEVRKQGLLSIDEKLPTYKDEFMRKGLQLAVDSIDPEVIREIMETELGFMIERHKLGVQFNERGAAFAPAFGMVATLVGLINMLGNMEDAGALMANMGMAMITTIYGCLMANILFLPSANKLAKRSDEEVLCKQIIIEGVLSIVNGDNPKAIQEKLVSYIPPSMRNIKSSGSAGGE